MVQVTRDDTGEVVIPESRVNYSTNKAVVDLSSPCDNYTVTVKAENKAGASMDVTRKFTLVESGECIVSTQCWCSVENIIMTKVGIRPMESVIFIVKCQHKQIKIILMSNYHLLGYKWRECSLNQINACICGVCVYACVRACVRVCVCVHASICVSDRLIQPHHLFSVLSQVLSLCLWTQLELWNTSLLPVTPISPLP